MLPNFKHDPYGGLIALRSHMPSPGQGLDSACAYAEQELGCVPSGRLRTYVLLSAGAAMLQRVRDDERVAYENESRLACGYPPFESPLRPLPYDDWAVEYLIASIQSGLKLGYDDAIAELTALFERLDP